ncbi:MAG: hypothetical protein R3E08_03650 [Thiotrichaceae bacterium]
MDKRLQAIATPAVPESPVTTDENAVANQSAEKTVETSTEKKSSGEKAGNHNTADQRPQLLKLLRMLLLLQQNLLK